jgi:CHAD domain-containing protein
MANVTTQDAPGFVLDLAAQQLARLRAHEAGARSGEDHEELHDLRVALRRLRTIARVFEDVLPPQFAALQAEMRWLDDVLGAVRDLDVQLELLGDGDRSAWSDIVRQLQRQRDEARQVLVQALSGQRYQHLTSEIERLTKACTETASAPDIHDIAAPALRSVYRRYHRKAKRLSGSATSEDLHDVRRRARRLRYMAEFLRDIYGPPARHLVRSVEAAQDVLGNYQDCVTSIHKLCEMPPMPDGETVALIQARRAQMRVLRAALPGVLSGVSSSWQELKPNL